MKPEKIHGAWRANANRQLLRAMMSIECHCPRRNGSRMPWNRQWHFRSL